MSLSSETALTHSMGQNGFKYLSTAGTATYATKKMCAIQALSASTVSCTSVRGDNLTSVQVQCGEVIVGEFSSVTCAGLGGQLLVYLSER
jgi:hypothetical protein